MHLWADCSQQHLQNVLLFPSFREPCPKRGSLAVTVGTSAPSLTVQWMQGPVWKKGKISKGTCCEPQGCLCLFPWWQILSLWEWRRPHYVGFIPKDGLWAGLQRHPTTMHFPMGLWHLIAVPGQDGRMHAAFCILESGWQRKRGSVPTTVLEPR